MLTFFIKNSLRIHTLSKCRFLKLCLICLFKYGIPKLLHSLRAKIIIFFKIDDFESYLSKLSKKHYSTLLMVGLSIHRLPVETGRCEKIPIEERKCTVCEANDIGDGFHFLFCVFFFNQKENNSLLHIFTKSLTLLNLRNYCLLKM